MKYKLTLNTSDSIVAQTKTIENVDEIEITLLNETVKQFVCTWCINYTPQIAIVQLNHFNEDLGYSIEEIKAISKLELHEIHSFADPFGYSHHVIRIV